MSEDIDLFWKFKIRVAEKKAEFYEFINPLLLRINRLWYGPGDTL
jgi:hypothetical protein